jgi:hypothetical protein
MTATQTDAPTVGTRQMSYLMTPNGLDGRATNGGMAYWNCDTEEQAIASAEKYVNAEGIGSVHIWGSLMELGYSGWFDVRGGATFARTIVRTAPVVYRGADLAKRCYDTTVLDHFETVHEQRSDCSCPCGKHAATFGVRS